jgi:EmrB/QacA subfamily drug resistance transporter
MKRNTMMILAGAMLGTLLFSLDQLIVATAIPQIVQELNGLSLLSWVFTSYMLTSTVIIPIYGKLSDIFGRKWLYIIGVVVFVLGSVLSGFSQDITQLILFRAIQGLGGGAMMVNTVAIIGDIFPPAERGKWQGLNMSMYAIATVAGPLLGGWMTDSFSWRWVFFINVPIGIIAVIVIATNMPSLICQTADRSIDFLGAGLITLGLVPLLLALVWGGGEYEWGSWQIIVLLVVAVIAFTIFALIERKTRNPILTLSFFKNKAYTISIIISFLTMIGLYGSILYIPLFAQGVTGVSATNSGIILMPMMVGMIITSLVGGQIISRTGKYRIITIIGMIATVLGMGLLIQIGQGTSYIDLSWRMVVLGAGLGIGFPIFTTVIQSAFGADRLGEVTAGSQLFRNIGGTVSTAILGGVMNNNLASQLANIQNDPFVTTINQLNPAAITKIDVNTIQGFLSPEGQSQIKTLIAHAPPADQAQLSAGLTHFLDTIKSALSFSIDHVYLVGAILMALALVIVFFLPQIPLRKHNGSSASK